jgi:3'-phosphoadenosine 5'-phosphosulfate synthase
MLSRPMVNILECKPGQVCRADALNRSRVIGQKGITLWMTGLSGSGKTTIAEALEKRLLYALGKNVFRIDGDNLRTGLTRDLGFSPDDRAESVRRASQVAALFSEAGIITMVTLISPYRKDRDAARQMHAAQGIPYMEVFMDVPLSVVQARDPKGLYKKVSSGQAPPWPRAGPRPCTSACPGIAFWAPRDTPPQQVIVILERTPLHRK